MNNRPSHGQSWMLTDGRTVTVLERVGDAYKAINPAGAIEIIYPRQFSFLVIP